MTESVKHLMIHNIDAMCVLVADAKAHGEPIGLVPTMGALHEGHLSLIRRASAENSLTVVSVFVNPIQFDDPGDLTSYPRTLHSDTEAAFNAGADIVFAPAAHEMYPDGFSTFIDMTGISEKLCGASRASHFRGVLTIVAKLFGICHPDHAYFGEKDAQQLAIIKKMVAELNIPVAIIDCPTVRESDGLAMSSRNTRLSAEERLAAHCLYNSLCDAKACFEEGETDAGILTAILRSELEKTPLARIDYAELVDPVSLESPVSAHEGDMLTLAVYIGNTRLIDNMRL